MMRFRVFLVNLALVFTPNVWCTNLVYEWSSLDLGTSEVVYEWSSLDLDWPSTAVRDEFIQNGSFVPDRNIVAGIKVYKGVVYLTIPRWVWTSGRPATLVKVVTVNGQDKLRPYPDWASQKLGDCQALQYVQSMEIDPNTGLMYVIDIGRAGGVVSPKPKHTCPAKLVIFDLNTDQRVNSFEFPETVVSYKNSMNDLVLDYVDNKVRYAYITDTSEYNLYVFDFERETVYYLHDDRMKPEEGNGTIINILGQDYTFNVGIDGIAMSWDFQYVYFCPLGGYNLYEIPTENLRAMTSNIDGNEIDMGIRLVGQKISQSDGMAHGRERLYFGALNQNAIYQWDRAHQIDKEMESQTQVVRDDKTLQWPDTLALDEHGWLWIASNRLQLFMTRKMDFTGADGSNVRVVKVFVNDTSYLNGAAQRTGIPDVPIIG